VRIVRGVYEAGAICLFGGNNSNWLRCWSCNGGNLSGLRVQVVLAFRERYTTEFGLYGTGFAL
jgi:hypothetical protein